jgi:hypothetical protein
VLRRLLVRSGLLAVAIAGLCAPAAVAAAAPVDPTTTGTAAPGPGTTGTTAPTLSPSTTSPSTVPPTNKTTTTTAAPGTAPGAAAPKVSASAAPVVTVTPDTGLLHGQVVTVAGTGFTPGASIGMAECRVGATDQSGCDVSTARSTTADGAGAWSVSFTVRRQLQLGSGTANCVPEGCTIGAANVNNITGEKAGMPLHFANVPPPPPPTLTVAPSTGLIHRQVVNVSGSGWAANQPVFLSQCVLNTGQCNANTGFVIANGAGGFATTFTVQREVGILGGTLTDCLSTACVLRAQSTNDPLAQNQVVLGFANVALPGKPVLTVTPSLGLGARETVTVTGRGYGANEDLTVAECTRNSTSANYSCFFFQPGATTDAAGSFSTTVTARRFIPGYPQPVDCAPSACLIAAYSYEDVLASTGADIAFDPNAPLPPPPTVTVSPSTGLADGQVVTVSGSGFSPHASVGMSQCRAGAATATDCAGGFQVASADANGSFSTQLTVHTQLRITSFSPGGPLGLGLVPFTSTVTTVDCTTAPGVCVIGAANLADFTEGGAASLSFGTTTAVAATAGSTGSSTTVRALAFTGASSARELTVGLAAAALGAVLLGLSRIGKRRRFGEIESKA